MDSKPPAKRARTKEGSGGDDDDDSSENILDPITPSVLEKSEELAAAYRDAQPYPHAMIHDFCKEGFLGEILTELKHNSKVKFKETDLFRVYQSVDLGNLQHGSELAEKMPALMKLKNAVYSPDYRAFVERITGLDPGTLTDEVDCAANCHAKGCHLLCHDDVIGTRKVSYIIYLTDPTPVWANEDGGRLELYDAIAENGDETSCVPGALPVKTILPVFNSMAYFVVKPGVSFHSVQEVFCDRPRLSIQGWYHAKESPAQLENATLSRLKSMNKGEDTEGGFEQLETSESITAGSMGECGSEHNSLSQNDRSFLGKYINAAYLTDKSMDEICKRFEEESSVQLRHFLLEEWNTKINGAFVKEDVRDKLGNNEPALDYHIGTNDKWKAVGPAHKQRFLQYESKDELVDSNAPNLNAGEYLHHLRQKVFQSAAFGRWLGWISSLGFPLGQRGRVRRFRPGLDYTVAHYGVLTTNAVLDATLCFCAGEGKQCVFDEQTNELLGSDDDAIWESGDVGGFECYIAADESGEDQGPDAEYDDEDDTKLLSVSASNNTLSLVYRDPGTMRFVKYVGSGAPSSRWDIALEYDVDVDDTDDEKNDEDDE
mmetsp:Transcript_22034/g.47916  ORF Transcript_22034/g.47916 Transcript_22034/m.47916 type:complete len:600 (+) Transcript_22034:224-2023(+)|eukprot:CAMPEP_0172318074 /NCGR_PEP_ID=MMETSP1058-20130122/33777_1 /TAXON_ID=83371 /ORGANISM="Detonula confervacea, Strain CCMP 353" /LENGTH=599 /DNA_ID=CAMNT_0013032803 /DNA_START=143 /DNA_END=1942 /DNA_ORIENTATION=-